mgnify:CR=1 FL=1
MAIEPVEITGDVPIIRQIVAASPYVRWNGFPLGPFTSATWYCGRPATSWPFMRPSGSTTGSTSAPTGDSDGDGHPDYFPSLLPGTGVCWDIHVKRNNTIAATADAQIFRATVNVIGDLFTPLDSRDIYFLVPPVIPGAQ